MADRRRRDKQFRRVAVSDPLLGSLLLIVSRWMLAMRLQALLGHDHWVHDG
jgi:hypothetical protein